MYSKKVNKKKCPWKKKKILQIGPYNFYTWIFLSHLEPKLFMEMYMPCSCGWLFSLYLDIIFYHRKLEKVTHNEKWLSIVSIRNNHGGEF